MLKALDRFNWRQKCLECSELRSGHLPTYQLSQCPCFETVSTYLLEQLVDYHYMQDIAEVN